jgi:hypothetical protein
VYLLLLYLPLATNTVLRRVVRSRRFRRNHLSGA